MRHGALSLDTDRELIEIQEIPALRGYQVEWAEEGSFLLSRRNQLYSSLDLTPPFQELGAYPAPPWKQFAARVRPAQRLLRFMFYNVLKLPNGDLFASFDKFVGLYSRGRFRSLDGLERPCRILRGACALDTDGNVFFGEYLMNPDRNDVHVYRYSSGDSSAKRVHTFPSGSVRHVHGVYFDPYDRCLWCVTGDNARECMMLRTHDGFRTLTEVGKGDETWRCVSLLFTEDSVFYATDAEFRENVIYRIDRKSGRRDAIHEVDGPVYYTAIADGSLFFAVTAELCPSQKIPAATLWRLDAQGQCRRVASFKKDRLPVALFLPGTLHFPRGPGRPGELLFHGVALTSADNRTFRVCT